MADRVLPGDQPLIRPTADPAFARRVVARYIALTTVVFVPLVLALTTGIRFYPIPVWSLFSHVPDTSQPHQFYRLCGETISGELIEIPAIQITNGLTNRNHTLISALDQNLEFAIPSPHPKNVERIQQAGGLDRLREDFHVPDVLRAWGEAYNRGKPTGSAKRLRAIELRRYDWDVKNYSDYDKVNSLSWRVEL
jgi:hypothetical protein